MDRIFLKRIIALAMVWAMLIPTLAYGEAIEPAADIVACTPDVGDVEGQKDISGIESTGELVEAPVPEMTSVELGGSFSDDSSSNDYPIKEQVIDNLGQEQLEQSQSSFDEEFSETLEANNATDESTKLVGMKASQITNMNNIPMNVLIKSDDLNKESLFKAYQNPHEYMNCDLYKAARHNTTVLQERIDAGGTVEIPSGSYYFAPGGVNPTQQDIAFVIKLRSNINLKGAGRKSTILLPLADRTRCSNISDCNSKYKEACQNSDQEGFCEGFLQSNPMGLDMFYFNDYKDNGYLYRNDDTYYLTNAHFSGFTINGAYAKQGTYSSAGKGFMINLFKDCSFDDVRVLNTDGSGFGVDCPINVTISNCYAEGCGKAAGIDGHGGSGFGIGTGYKNGESITITRCQAVNNGKFGFFFEDQARFEIIDPLSVQSKANLTDEDLAAEKINSHYPATYIDTDDCTTKYIVSNCTATDNLFNFGGLYAFNTTYSNCKSKYTKVNGTNPYIKMHKMYKTEILEKIHDDGQVQDGYLTYGMFWGNKWLKSRNCKPQPATLKPPQKVLVTKLARVNGKERIKVQWSSVKNNTGYRLYYSADDSWSNETPYLTLKKAVLL